MIEVRHLTHVYGTTVALQDVSLEVPRGKVIGLVGPNGAGKTTLIRAVATLLRYTRGVVRVQGHDTLGQAAKARRAVGYLPERANPYPDLLAWEHLDLYASIAGLRGADKRRRVDEALAAAGLSDRRRTPSAHLSKGLRQRLALQAALLHDPVAFVLDEPTDGLDPDSRDALLATARDLADKGAAVLLSSHVLAELEQITDDVVILSRGRVVTASEAPRGLRYRVVVREGAAAAQAVTPGRVDGDALIVDVPEDQPDAAGIVSALVGAGLHVIEVRGLSVSLRDRYRSAVGGDQ